jgi:hypothetical protein
MFACEAKSLLFTHRVGYHEVVNRRAPDLLSYAGLA